jgi:3-dehydroquinate dehydratase-1
MIKIGECCLGKRPCIVAIVDDFIPAGKLQLLKDHADLLEMRIDCFHQPVDRVTHYLHEIRSKVGMPMIGTVRENDFTKNNRIGIFRAIVPFVDSVDIELGTPISDEVLTIAKGKKIIVSEHDFTSMPDVAALRSMVDRSKKQGADIVKIAAMANSRDDVIRLLQFTRECTEPIVTIAMGPHGTVSRVIAPLFGSLFSYGYLEYPVAPGQLPVAKLIEEFRCYYPDELAYN